MFFNEHAQNVGLSLPSLPIISQIPRWPQVWYHRKVKILSGSELAGFIKERQAKQVRALRQAHGIFPRLAIVANVDNPVIDVYMRLKQDYGADILIDVEIHRVDSDSLADTISELNSRDDVQAIIVQLPLEDMSRADDILALVSPSKDVDGLSPNSNFDAATPIAINWLLAGYGVDLAGKKIALVGRGRLVGRPLERMWLDSGLDVSVFEEGSDLLALKEYDLVVTAAGAPHIITSEMIRPGAIVVDAGTSSEDGVVRGDVSPEVRQRDDLTITPEKGGVGPLTVAALFDNVIKAYLKIANDKAKATR